MKSLTLHLIKFILLAFYLGVIYIWNEFSDMTLTEILLTIIACYLFNFYLDQEIK